MSRKDLVLTILSVVTALVALYAALLDYDTATINRNAVKVLAPAPQEEKELSSPLSGR